MPIQATDPGTGAGFDKHWGRYTPYIVINNTNWWWDRLTINTSVVTKENTDPGSPLKQYQMVRYEPVTIELESMIPRAGGNNTAAALFMSTYHVGVIVDHFYCDILNAFLTAGGIGTGASAYGAFIVEKSDVRFTRDDFAVLSATIRALGYGAGTLVVDPGEAYTPSEDTGSVADSGTLVDSAFGD